MNSTKHILVIRLSSLGDVAMTVPVLRAFTKQNPTIKITVLSKPFLKPFFEEIPNVSFFNAEVNGKHKGFFGLLKLAKELRKLGVTEVADLHNVLRSKIISACFSVRMKKVVHLNKGRSEKRALTRETNKVFKQLKTTHERYADVFRKLGYNLDISNPEFPPKKELTSEILEITGEKKDKWIGVAPFSQYDSKNYPLDLLEKVIEQLSEKENIKILLFGGGEKEVEILTGIENKYKNTINIAGKIRIKQEIKLISNLDCMLSMDSGNGHFAAMLGVKVVTLWGATHPFTGFSPFNQPIENCIIPNLEKYPKLPSSIYGNKVLEGYEDAMRSIKPEIVVEKILEVL